MEWNKKSKERLFGNYKIKFWLSLDMKYRISKIERDGSLIGYVAEKTYDSKTWDVFEHDSQKGIGYPRYYSSIKECMSSVDLNNNKGENDEYRKGKRAGTEKGKRKTSGTNRSRNLRTTKKNKKEKEIQKNEQKARSN